MHYHPKTNQWTTKDKGLDYEELESMVNDNIKILLEKIETNNIIGRVGNLFDINDKEPEEEVKKSNTFLLLLHYLHLILISLIMIKQKKELSAGQNFRYMKLNRKEKIPTS